MGSARCHFLDLKADRVFEILATNPQNCIKKAKLKTLSKGAIKKLAEGEMDELEKVYKRVKTSRPQ